MPRDSGPRLKYYQETGEKPVSYVKNPQALSQENSWSDTLLSERIRRDPSHMVGPHHLVVLVLREAHYSITSKLGDFILQSMIL